MSLTVSVQRRKKSARDDGEQREHERKENARRVRVTERKVMFMASFQLQQPFG